MTRDHVDLLGLNTLRVPAMAEHFAEVTMASQLTGLLAHARSNHWPITVLGEGSNVVLGDLVPGLVLAVRNKGITVLDEEDSHARLQVAAGENWHMFVRWCLQRGYSGLENLALIPGSVGAAPIQNIGAYGVEVGSFIETVQCRLLPDGEQRQLTREDCLFGYRDSVFKQDLCDAAVIESVTFRLPKTPDPVTTYPSLASYLEAQGVAEPTAEQVFDAVVTIRSTRLPDPEALPNVGSFFKNPVVAEDRFQALAERFPNMPHYDDAAGHKLPAAWLIEQCGFKQREGAVRVHAEHALVIINPEQRPAREIAVLAREITDEVRARFGILLEQEPRRYGIFEQ
ncbi:MAG: UDP-N-acetylmuramate dehydrogenase [Halieaceae bacterium]|jgi:UDP-N-acetylmuramate dehydrogenase|nr:UDP-N-acetylmuramate dehydrogenase [Halieaceae bacterium]